MDYSKPTFKKIVLFNKSKCWTMDQIKNHQKPSRPFQTHIDLTVYVGFFILTSLIDCCKTFIYRFISGKGINCFNMKSFNKKLQNIVDLFWKDFQNIYAIIATVHYNEPDNTWVVMEHNPVINLVDRFSKEDIANKFPEKDFTKDQYGFWFTTTWSVNNGDAGMWTWFPLEFFEPHLIEWSNSSIEIVDDGKIQKRIGSDMVLKTLMLSIKPYHEMSVFYGNVCNILYGNVRYRCLHTSDSELVYIGDGAVFRHYGFDGHMISYTASYVHNDEKKMIIVPPDFFGSNIRLGPTFSGHSLRMEFDHTFRYDGIDYVRLFITHPQVGETFVMNANCSLDTRKSFIEILKDKMIENHKIIFGWN